MREHSEQLDQLATALASAQAEFTAIPKTETNPFFKSKYAGLPSVVEAASPILTKHGLSVSQHLGCDETGDTLTTWLLHKSGQFIASTMRLHLSKQDAQGQGSATTYARRYAYMGVLGLVADEDDDGNRASGGRPQQRPQAVRNPTVSLIDPAGVRTLAHNAKGLTVAQIKLALTSLGLSARDGAQPGEWFEAVPADKAAALAQALSGMEREAA